MLKQIEEIQRNLMKKVECRPFNVYKWEDGNFNFIHQEFVADAFVEVRKLVKESTHD